MLHAKEDSKLLEIVRSCYSKGSASRWTDEFQEVHSVKEDSSKGLILATSSKVVVAFPGTDDCEDALLDILAMKTRMAGGRVHSGFLMAYLSLQHQVHAAMMLVNPHKSKPVTVCGHSLGGAMALLAAMDLHQWRYNVDTAVVAGCPMVGDKEWTATLEEAGVAVRSYRNAGDAVPLLPPLRGYEDLPGGVLLRSGMEPVIGYSNPRFSLKALLYMITRSKDGHSLSDYKELLDELH